MQNEIDDVALHGTTICVEPVEGITTFKTKICSIRYFKCVKCRVVGVGPEVSSVINCASYVILSIDSIKKRITELEDENNNNGKMMCAFCKEEDVLAVVIDENKE